MQGLQRLSIFLVSFIGIVLYMISQGIGLLDFKQIYELAKDDASVSIPNGFLWGSYKPWLLCSYSQAVVNGDRDAFSYLYLDASSETKEPRYQTDARTDFNNEFEFFADKSDAQNFSRSVIVDHGLRFSTKLSFYKLWNEKDSKVTGWQSVISNDVANQEGFFAAILLFKIESLNVPAFDTYLNMTVFPNGEFLIYKANQTRSSSKNQSISGYYVRASSNGQPIDPSMFSFSYFGTKKLEAWDCQDDVVDKLVKKENSTFLTFDSVFPNESSNPPLSQTSIIALELLLPYHKSNQIQTYFSQFDPMDTEEFRQRANDYFLNQTKTEETLSQKFDEKYNKSFEAMPNISEAHFYCAQRSFSELMSGLGYYWGNLSIEYSRDYRNKLSAKLFSMTPARVGLQVGFQWDEGFHQLINCRFNLEGCMLIMRSWFNLEDSKGWLAPFEVRGDEAKKQAPEGYAEVLYNVTNPPTFILVVDYLIGLLDSFEEDAEEHKRVKSYLDQLYPFIHTFYKFFKKSQQTSPSLFSWFTINSTTNGTLLFGSGMPDYPRENSNGDLPIFNLDLQTWMTWFASRMGDLSQVLGRPNDSGYFIQDYDLFLGNLTKYFYDKSSGIYSEPYHDGSFSKHFGYVSLMPFLFNLGMTDDILHQYLERLNDNETIWSPYGIRSLSKKDEYFHKGSNLWRGNIWINLNYMVLRALKTHYWNKTRVPEYYKSIRNNLIENTCGIYNQTNYFFQNYDSLTGEGTSYHPFNGWTSLISLIIHELY